jgi:hypothetical protein
MKNYNDKNPVYSPMSQNNSQINIQMNGKKIKKGGCGCNNMKKIK